MEKRQWDWSLIELWVCPFERETQPSPYPSSNWKTLLETLREASHLIFKTQTWKCFQTTFSSGNSLKHSLACRLYAFQCIVKVSKYIYMLICSGILASWKGVGGRLVNRVFSLRGPWECDFFVPSRFKHIPVKPWILWALIPCSKTTCWSGLQDEALFQCDVNLTST